MRGFLALSLLALAVPAAHAGAIRYDFEISLAHVLGTQPGTGTADGSGFFVFDSDLAMGSPGSRVGDLNTPLPTLALSFDWLGMHFDESSAALGALYVDGFGGVTGWSLDGLVAPNRCQPAFQCVQWGTSDFNILAFGTSIGAGSALLTQSGVDGVAIGWVTWNEVRDVPEPGAFSLLALGIASFILRRRKTASA